MRTDLRNLTQDDLATLANRGLVKRAQKELETGEHQAVWEEKEDGTIIATWSDGVKCVLPGSKTIQDAQCDCPAADICRHILRTVLAWQMKADSLGNVSQTWDPGRMQDDLLTSQVSKNVMDRAKMLWKQGSLCELLRAVKPSARFHFPGHTVRFLVPDDIRYAKCSCSDPAPCPHALLAIWAFRKLAPEKEAGIVSEGPMTISVPTEPLIEGSECLKQLMLEGMSRLQPAWRDHLRRAVTHCQEQHLHWPGQILEEIAADYERYHTQDALFDPEGLVQRVAEYFLRKDALISATGPVPQAFVRGLPSDKDTDLGTARFVGLGATATEARSYTSLCGYLQDVDTGHMVSVIREFSEKDGVRVKSFSQLAQSSAVKDASFYQLSAGQLLTQGGRRTAAGKLVIGRAKAAVNPQNFQWENLKAPVLVEDFTEVNARLNLLPPPCFRPRRLGGDFHVCRLLRIEHAHFDPITNSLTALMVDQNGGTAVLHHPWTDRGRIGSDALLNNIIQNQPLFVAGLMQRKANGLTVHPTAVVFVSPKGGRTVVLPWLEAKTMDSEVQNLTASPLNLITRSPRHRYYPAIEFAGHLLLQGHRSHSSDPRSAARAQRELAATGCHRLSEKLQQAIDSPESIENFFKMLGLGLVLA